MRGDLDNIVAKALKKQAAERYPTVAALADDLRHYLDHQPVSARADSLAYRAGKFVRRHRVAVGAASMTLLALLAGVIGTTWQAMEARNQRDRALAEIRYSRVNHEVLMSLLDDALRSGANEQWREMLDRAREQLRVRHENDPMSQARVLLMLAGRYATLNDERGEAAVTAALEQLEPSLPDPAVRAQIACARADLLLYARDVEARAAIGLPRRCSRWRASVIRASARWPTAIRPTPRSRWRKGISSGRSRALRRWSTVSSVKA